MIMYYKILDKSLTVKFYKPFFENSKVTEQIFMKKGELIEIDKIRQKIPEPYASDIIVKMRRLQEINNMKLSVMGATYDEENRKIIYLIGNCSFDDRKQAIIHGENLYGSEFVNDNISRFNGRRLYYLKNTDQISEREYKELKEEHKDLLKINIIKLNKNILR